MSTAFTDKNKELVRDRLKDPTTKLHVATGCTIWTESKEPILILLTRDSKTGEKNALFVTLPEAMPETLVNAVEECLFPKKKSPDTLKNDPLDEMP